MVTEVVTVGKHVIIVYNDVILSMPIFVSQKDIMMQ